MATLGRANVSLLIISHTSLMLQNALSQLSGLQMQRMAFQTLQRRNEVISRANQVLKNSQRMLSHVQMQRMMMSSGSTTLNLNPGMTLDDVQKVHRLQNDFEKEPHNSQVAYELFTELNKHGKYNTVVRLYDKYELEYGLSLDPYKERMKS